jgi:glycosyltransferase involved in cell wall biosynthesis
MYRNQKISLVIPAYNEEKLIRNTLGNIPQLFDRIFVVDDKSPDNQNTVILDCSKIDPRVSLLKHTVNQGPGGAIITGYTQSAKEGYHIAVVVGGDFQMKLDEVERFLDPIIDGKVDYTKGNRFLLSTLNDTMQKMPKLRFFANWMITALTKIASGYYKVMDVVDGYTAISHRAIETIDWSKAWKGYGYPMDFLIRLNAYGFKILDVPRTAVYLPGERQSQIKGFKYFWKVSPMLIRHFFWRLNFKYLYRDFHPMVFFYYLSFILLPIGLGLGLFFIADKILTDGVNITPSRTVLNALFLITGTQFLLFAMWFDMEEGK